MAKIDVLDDIVDHIVEEAGNEKTVLFETVARVIATHDTDILSEVTLRLTDRGMSLESEGS